MVLNHRKMSSNEVYKIRLSERVKRAKMIQTIMREVKEGSQNGIFEVETDYFLEFLEELLED